MVVSAVVNIVIGLLAAATALEENADELTRLDSLAGDGDLGRTAIRIAEAMREVIATGEVDSTKLLLECGKRIAMKAPSSCGTLVAIGFLAASKALEEEMNPSHQLASALVASVEAISKRGKASPGDRTMLDALAPSAAAASKIEESLPFEDYLAGVSKAAEQGMHATREMIPRIGRARALPEQAQGNPDPGAVLIFVALGAGLLSIAEQNR